MAQIIKHRRGRISQLKGTAARNGELIIASGSIDDLQGPFVFIGSPVSTDEGIAGAFNSVSRIYQGTAAPTITAGTYGSVLDGTPFYASGDKSLYILNNSNAGGNTKIDLSGNLESNTISGITINGLTSSFISSSANITSLNMTASYFTGAFIGDGTKLTGVPISGVTGLDTSKILSGSYSASISELGGLQINTDTAISGTIYIGESTDSQIYNDGALFVQDHTNGVTIASNNYAELQSGDAWVWVEGSGAYVEGGTFTKVYTDSGNVQISAYDGGTLSLNADNGEGDIHIGVSNLSNSTYINSYNTFITGANSTYMGMNGNTAHFKTTADYAEMYGNTGLDVFSDSGNLWVYNNSGNVSISSYDGSTLELNTDGGEGNINLGNNSNSVWGYTTVTNFAASDYAQLGSNNSYVWVDADGAYIQQDGSSVVGFTARPNGTIEATGSLNIYGDTQIDGNTSVTGALVVSNGSATFDQGLVAQNSNMLLTSGSNLIVQNGGNVTVDTIYGATHNNNYLAFNGGQLGAQQVELNSGGNISLFAEGGSVNVTGSLNVTGDIVFSGSIHLGDFTGDTVNFTGEVSSSILPQVSASFDLGSATQTWNNVYAQKFYGDGSNITNLPISGLTGLDQSRIVSGSYSGSISELGGFQVNTDTSVTGSLSVSNTIYAGSGNSQIYNDGAMYVEDLTNGVQVRGGNSNKLELANNGYVNLYSNGSGVDIEANGGQLWLWSDYHDVNISSYDGSSLNLNHDGGEGNVNIGNGNNSLNINSDTYINTNRTLYVNRMHDNSDNSNYLELYGSNTNDGYWWESGSGADTTLNNNWGGAHTNILNTNSGNVNIDATGGSVNIHSNNGTNITGSLVVSDGSGVFNSSLIVNNSDLTLDGGSNIHMDDSAHLYFDTCVDMYWDNGSGNFVFYNDCNNFSFQNNISVTGSLNVSSRVYAYGDIDTYNIYGADNGNNHLALNGGAYGAPQVELASSGQISLFSEGGGSEYAINMTGSVHMMDSADISGSLTVLNNVTASFFTGAFVGDGSQLTNVPSSGVTGLMLNKIYDGNVSASITEAHGFQVNTNSAFTGSVTVSGSIFDVYSTTHVHNDLYVSGNLTILGSGTTVHISSSQIDIGTSIINLNTYAPFERFAGISVYDSGSNIGVTGSLLWDSTNDVWIYSNPSGSNYASARLISGPQNTGSLGEEIGITINYLTKAVGDDHIGDSLLYDDGTIFTYNTNKFIVTGSTGDTYINGNVTINGAGGTDLAGGSSWVTFRNDDGILGFVDSTDTEDEMDQLLGYRNSDGALVFSSLLDGGTY